MSARMRPTGLGNFSRGLEKRPSHLVCRRPCFEECVCVCVPALNVLSTLFPIDREFFATFIECLHGVSDGSLGARRPTKAPGSSLLSTPPDDASISFRVRSHSSIFCSLYIHILGGLLTMYSSYFWNDFEKQNRSIKERL